MKTMTTTINNSGSKHECRYRHSHLVVCLASQSSQSNDGLVVSKSQIEPLMKNEVLHIRVLDEAV